MGGEPWSHPVSAHRPLHAGFLSSFSGNAEEELALKPGVLKAKLYFLSLSDRIIVTWKVVSACPCVHEQVVKKTETAKGDRGSNWILARLMLSFSSVSHHLSSSVFFPPPDFSFGCSTLCRSVVPSVIRRTTSSLTKGSRVGL